MKDEENIKKHLLTKRFDKVIFAGILVSIFVSLISVYAIGADISFCETSENFYKILKDKYKEKPIAAYNDAGGLKVLFGNGKTGTWTLAISPIGSNDFCTMRNGNGFQSLRQN